MIQHSWATAVEVAGLITQNNPKLGQGNIDFIRFFSVASEILARRYEGSTSSLPHLTDAELATLYADLENSTRIMQMFRRVNSKIVDIDFKKNNILIFPFVRLDEENTSSLSILSFENVTRAIERYNQIESELAEIADVVLVRADSFENLRVTFRNYFADTTDFVQLLDDALNFR